MLLACCVINETVKNGDFTDSTFILNESQQKVYKDAASPAIILYISICFVSSNYH